MQNSLTEISSDCIQTVMDGLRKNNMDVQYVPHKEEAAAAVASLLKEGDTIAVGGSVTLEETGVLELDVYKRQIRLWDTPYTLRFTKASQIASFVQSAARAHMLPCSKTAGTL